MSFALKAGFLSCIIVCLSSLFVPQMYDFLADFTLQQMGIKESIQELDDKFILNAVTETTEDIWDDLTGLFGTEDDETDEKPQEGFFEQSLYPSLVSTVAFLFRALALSVSLIGLVGIVYLSYATGGAYDVQKLKSDYASLAERIKVLERGGISP
jgi:hypothetical protein